MIQPCYTTKHETIPEGQQVAIRDLRYNDTFVYDSRSGVYTIHSTDPIKIKRPDGWIVRCGDESRIVFKCSANVTKQKREKT